MKEDSGRQMQVVARDLPRGTPETPARRSAANSEQRLAEQALELAHEGEVFDKAYYEREILPRLQSVSTSAIAKATGASTSSGSKWKGGLRTPHPRSWEALRSLGSPQ